MNQKPVSFTAKELEYLLECVNRDPRGLPSVAVVQGKLCTMLVEVSPFVQCATKHIWMERATGKYLFSDEASQFDEGRYDTEAEAAKHLFQYISWLG